MHKQPIKISVSRLPPFMGKVLLRAPTLAIVLFIVPSIVPSIALAHADPVTDASLLFAKGDAAGGLKLLEQASADGSLPAKGMLAQSLLTLAPPYRDAARACRLAGEAADAGDGLGQISLADCFLAGALKSDEPFEAARVLARKALAAGQPEGGYELYKAYLLDPTYSYVKDGKADKAKYDQLAAMSVAQRTVQIEALNGLGRALESGNYAALNAFVTYLSATTAPSNVDRLLNTAAYLQKAANVVPLQAHTQKIIQIAQLVKQMGKSNVSQKVIVDAYPGMLIGAATAITRKAGATCNAGVIKLTSIAAETIDDPEYLPLKGIMNNTYLLHGAWREKWTYAGCGTEVELSVKFSADGAGGAIYTATLPPTK